jgi:hypothetical protein
MTTAYPAAATHRPSLFAALLAAIMPAFNVLHDAHWRAPWRRA